MSGKKKREGGKQFIEATLGDAVDIEGLAIATDDELSSLVFEHQRAHQRAHDSTWRRTLEDTMCYLQREVQIRAARREAHDSYVKRLEEENTALGNVAVLSTTPEIN